MPVLPFVPGQPINGDLPITSIDDINSIVPFFIKSSDSAPVRDAIFAALLALFLEYQVDSGVAVGQSDILRAVGSALTGLGEDRGVFKTEGEDDELYRARILNIPNIVTPNAILAAVNSILAPFTSIQAEYCESIGDRWYVGDHSSRPWHSFLWDSTESMSPTYLDRLYKDDAPNNLGFFVPNRNPGGARVFNDTFGRLFLIRIPDLSGVDLLGGFVNSTSLIDRFYVGGIGVASAIRVSGTTALDTFNNIVTTVQRLKGQSIRFVIYSDPKLKL